MKKKYLFILFFCFFTKLSNAQVQLSVYAEISIITAGPGDELFEAFGHSAIRIKDPVLQLDLIYNYGMFDFNSPNFYGNFVKGKLLYQLGRYKFEYFLRSYNKDKRWIKEQILNLNQSQKQAFFLYLEKNAQPKNASYLYDPYFNNCATKILDITKSILKDKVIFNDTIKENLSFRELMNDEIHWNTWGNFGINLALGSKLDKKATYYEQMYLPDYIYSSFKNAEIIINNQSKKLIKKENVLLDYEEKTTAIQLFNPLLLFSIIAIIGLLITYFDFKNKKRTKWFDFILFFTTGLIGILIVFLWFFTNHSTTPNNFNFLWAFAPNIIIGFVLLKNTSKKWMKKYVLILLLMLFSLPVIWILNIQLFPMAVIPLLILLSIRYLFLYKTLLTSVK